MNLFVSFILRAISVFIKDGVLYAEQDGNHCFISTVSKTRIKPFSLIFFPVWNNKKIVRQAAVCWLSEAEELLGGEVIGGKLLSQFTVNGIVPHKQHCALAQIYKFHFLTLVCFSWSWIYIVINGKRAEMVFFIWRLIFSRALFALDVGKSHL